MDSSTESKEVKTSSICEMLIEKKELLKKQNEELNNKIRVIKDQIKQIHTQQKTIEKKICEILELQERNKKVLAETIPSLEEITYKLKQAQEDRIKFIERLKERAILIGEVKETYIDIHVLKIDVIIKDLEEKNKELSGIKDVMSDYINAHEKEINKLKGELDALKKQEFDYEKEIKQINISNEIFIDENKKKIKKIDHELAWQKKKPEYVKHALANNIIYDKTNDYDLIRLVHISQLMTVHVLAQDLPNHPYSYGLVPRKKGGFRAVYTCSGWNPSNSTCGCEHKKKYEIVTDCIEFEDHTFSIYYNQQQYKYIKEVK